MNVPSRNRSGLERPARPVKMTGTSRRREVAPTIIEQRKQVSPLLAAQLARTPGISSGVDRAVSSETSVLHGVDRAVSSETSVLPEVDRAGSPESSVPLEVDRAG